MSRPPVLFYSAWPRGYHNLEAERKAEALAAAGYPVYYVTGVGIRNPRLSRPGKLADRIARKLGNRASHTAPTDGARLRDAALAVLPPRQLKAMRRLNARWIERQLHKAVPDLQDAVAWVRWPTPELADALAELRPAVLVYECVDAYIHTPGIVGKWIPIMESAERHLVSQADMVVTCGEVLAERYRAWGAEVRVIPHGVDLFEWFEPARRGGRPITTGFVGTLDYRLDMTVLTHIAGALPDWRMRLVGPVQPGFDPGRLAGFPNVSIEPPVPHHHLGRVLAEFDVGLMPYFDHPEQRAMCPVKNLELLAAGRPAVAKKNPALLPYEEVLYFADNPTEFVAQLRRAYEEDSPQRARERRSIAERHTWDRRLAEVVALVGELVCVDGARAGPQL